MRVGEILASPEAAVRQEILERARHKHQRPEFLVQNICNKLAVDPDTVHRILDQLLAEGLVKNEDFNGIPMISIVRK